VARFIRANPALFGEDVGALAWTAVGVATSGVVNDKVVSPLVGRFLPQAFGSEMIGKVVDAFSTALTGWGLGEVVGMIDRRIGHRIRSGGVMLGIAKLISVVLPGFSLTGTLPGAASSWIPSLAERNAKALAAGNGGNTISPGRVLASIGTMGI